MTPSPAEPADEGTGPPAEEPMRILIVCEHASARFGGEAILPLHWFKHLRQAGDDMWLISHARTIDELTELFPDCHDRLHFTKDTPMQQRLHRLRSRFASRIFGILLDQCIHLITQMQQRRIAKELVRTHSIDWVLEPMPVSPRQPSLMFNLGAPVVIGPMNGGMSYPPGFRDQDSRTDRILIPLARFFAAFSHFVFPGKRKAWLLLVANQRTRAALPWSIRKTPTVELVENGIDPSRWVAPAHRRTPSKGDTYSFAYVGRLVDLKAVNILINAFADIEYPKELELHIYGDGPTRATLEAQATSLKQDSRIRFHGFVPQHELPALLSKHNCLVLPSLYECGGAVVLEAMSLGLPVIATNWGGPADYLDDTCGVLVDPVDRSTFQASLQQAMEKLAADPSRSKEMGLAGTKRVLAHFAWPNKVARLRTILETRKI